MADGLRQSWRFAASLTILGLIADISGIQVQAAAMFALDHRWLEAAAYFVVGSLTMLGAAAAALTRAQRDARRDR